MRFDHPSIQKVAMAQGKSQAQIFLRWGLQHVSLVSPYNKYAKADMKGYIVIPKSVSEERIISNSEVFDFELSSEEMKEVSLWPSFKIWRLMDSWMIWTNTSSLIGMSSSVHSFIEHRQRRVR